MIANCIIVDADGVADERAIANRGVEALCIVEKRVGTERRVGRAGLILVQGVNPGGGVPLASRVAVERLKTFRAVVHQYEAAGSTELFESLKQLLADEVEAPSRAQIALKLGMTENAVRQALHRLRQRYQVLLREEISHTVAIASDVEDELGHLIAGLRT